MSDCAVVPRCIPDRQNDNHLPGAEPDEHLQLGTGTFDTTFGLSYVYADLPCAPFASTNASPMCVP